MPRNICISCSRKLKSSHEFIKQAQEANHKCLASLLVTKKSNNSIKVDCLQESEIDIRQCLEIKIEVGEEIKQVCEDGVRVDFVSDEHKCKLEPKFEVLEDNVSCENMPEISKNSAIEVTDTVE